MDLLEQWAVQVLVEQAPRGFAGITTLVVGWLIARAIASVLRGVLVRAGIDATVAGFGSGLAKITMMTLVVITALDKFGFPAVSFAAVVGAAGLAIGLALKGVLSNFAAGAILIALRPFKVGAHIDAAGNITNRSPS